MGNDYELPIITFFFYWCCCKEGDNNYCHLFQMFYYEESNGLLNLKPFFLNKIKYIYFLFFYYEKLLIIH
jgi:hypothetical protein